LYFPANPYGSEYISITKGVVMLLSTIIYSLISLVLILYKSFKKD
jgi:hypothetical protein